MDNDALAESVSARLREHINKRVDGKATEREEQLVGTIEILDQRISDLAIRVAELEQRK